MSHQVRASTWRRTTGRRQRVEISGPVENAKPRAFVRGFLLRSPQTTAGLLHRLLHDRRLTQRTRPIRS